MSDELAISKIDAARQQLDTALDLLFHNSHPVAVHTLVGAASNIISDLVSIKCPNNSWDTFAQQSNSLTPRDYFRIMREAQNFFKHAKNDSEEKLKFDSSDTDSIAFWAVMNLGELGYVLSVKESVFQLWYLASYSPVLTEDDFEPNKLALQLFGDLRKDERSKKLENVAYAFYWSNCNVAPNKRMQPDAAKLRR